MQLFGNVESIYIKRKGWFLMKKCLCFLIILAMLMPSIFVSADTAASKRVEDVLVMVKEKIQIPDELTEFSSYTSSRNDKEIFTFLWQDKDGKAHIEITADDKGRITDYYAFDSTLKTDKKITVLSKKDIVDFAENFLRKTVPEAFVDANDCLAFDEDSWNVSNLNYNLTYKRIRSGIDVKDNYASIRIAVYDDVAYVRNMNLNIKFDAEFDDAFDEKLEYIEKYKESFPIELIYKSDYRAVKDGEEDKAVLVYRYKNNDAGYILATDGEAAKEDAFDEIFASGGNSLNMGATEDSTARKEMLTEAEIEELAEIEDLISKEEVEKILKKLPYVGLDNSLKLTSFDVRKNNDRYELSLAYENEKKDSYLSATVDGRSKEILNLYQRLPVDSEKDIELSETQKNQAKTKIESFLKTSSPKTAEFREEHFDSYGSAVNYSLDRYVNGIRYIDNSISIRFDARNNKILNYRLNFDNDKSFPKPDGIVEAKKAHNNILELSSLEKIYVHSDGKYRLCFGVKNESAEIDAFTGEEYKLYKAPESFKYSDIKGHWAEDEINKLAEVQIGFEGEKFAPDEAIKQSDLLKIFAAGTRHKSYLDFDTEELYRILIDEEVILESEKNPESQVKREDAFVFMIRLQGLEKVAKLSEIFKVSYADQDLLTKEKTGYAAILTGMNIICGNGGKLRPKDNITRAETAVMLYNYMIK